MFAVEHSVGALYKALSVLKEAKINLSKIESRPSRNKAWEYYFFVDIDGHVEDEPVENALNQLRKGCTLLTILGSYPNAKDNKLPIKEKYSKNFVGLLLICETRAVKFIKK